MNRIIQFTSPQLKFRLLENATPYRGEVDGWHVVEDYTPPESVSQDGTYRLKFTKAVASSEEAFEAKSNGIDLVEDLEKVWAYGMGLPLRSAGFGVFLVKVEVREGWETTADNVMEDLKAEETGLRIKDISPGMVHHRAGTEFPFRGVKAALDAYHIADDVTKELIRLHYEAHHARGDAGYFLLAKALEIVRSVLAGKTNDEKQEQLPADTRDRLSHSLDWLFEIANNRVDIRHAVVKGSDGKLHPRLEGSDGLDFLVDADNVVRGVICERLGVPQIILGKL